MDRIFYGLKRAYQSTLRLFRRDFEVIGNTPARMDILHALYNRGRKFQRPMWQSQLRRVIGYTARSTMTQILQALERLLWVRRKRSEEDRRQLEVELTEWGRNVIRRAYVHFGDARSVEGPSWAIDWKTPLPAELEAWGAYRDRMGRLDKILRNIRFALRDTGTLHYQWFGD
jgi:DNA-binding MarR family transcriptional regulator